MYIRNYMLPKEKLTTVSLDESLKSALDKINQGNFLSLPVVENNEFKGIIMKEAVYRSFFSSEAKSKEEYLENTRVEAIFQEKYHSVKAGEFIEKASYLLKEIGTPFLPVFDQDKFAGILTHHAIFKAFSDIFGFGKGAAIVINIFDLPGQLAKITDIIKKEGLNILNIAIIDPEVMDLQQVIVRVDTENVESLVNRFQQAGFKIGEIQKK